MTLTHDDDDNARINITPAMIQLLVTVTAIVGSFAYMRSDLNAFIKTSVENQTEIRSAQSQIVNLRMELRDVQADLKYFREAYEKDMNKYIRERK